MYHYPFLLGIWMLGELFAELFCFDTSMKRCTLNRAFRFPVDDADDEVLIIMGGAGDDSRPSESLRVASRAADSSASPTNLSSMPNTLMSSGTLL